MRTLDLPRVPGFNRSNDFIVNGPVEAGRITGGEAAEFFKDTLWISHRNLLDNWYFVGGGSQRGGGQFPINQQGKTTYETNGNEYVFDRWNTQGTTVTLEDDGVTFQDGNGFNQSIECPERLLGKTVTLSALVAECTMTSVVFGLTAAVNAFNHTDWLVSSRHHTDGLWTATGTLPSSMGDWSHLNFGMWFPSAGKNKIRAVKLELGDTQTLAHKEGDTWVLNDPPPNYALELAKCQRSFVRYSDVGSQVYLGMGIHANSNYLNIPIFTPVPMRANPTLSFNNISIFNGANEVKLENATVRAIIASNNIVMANIRQNGAFTEAIYEVIVGAGGYLELNSEP